MNKDAAAKAVKETYPSIDWDRFEDIDRALNFDLWYGTGSEYWGKAEDLEHYTWEGSEKAVKDLEKVLEPLPHEMWVDCEGEWCVVYTNPDDFDAYWHYYSVDGEHELEYRFENSAGRYFCIEDGKEYEPNLNCEAIWVGGEWEKFNVRQVLMFDETYRQVF